ncbi:MAG: transaldolase family protein [Halioglobus sp.]|nr:transaldolase family protein [Halioglobus sp.]
MNGRASARWRALAERGARAQRLLWASTSTKDEAYSELKYVEALVGPDTVNTLPPGTLAAYRDGGRPALTLESDLDAARALPQRLSALGIDLETVAEALEREGVHKFVEPYDALLRVLEQRASRE